MSLLDVLRAGVSIANSVTKPIQTTVSFQHCTDPDTDGYGAKTYAAPVPLEATVELKQRQVRTPQGELAVSSVTVMFLDPAVLVSATSGAGMTVHDIIVLADGKTGPILNFGGYLDPGTGTPFATEVYLG